MTISEEIENYNIHQVIIATVGFINGITELEVIKKGTPLYESYKVLSKCLEKLYDKITSVDEIPIIIEKNGEELTFAKNGKVWNPTKMFINILSEGKNTIIIKHAKGRVWIE